MSNGYLDQLAIDKTPACRRAINRMLVEIQKRSEAFNTPVKLKPKGRSENSLMSVG